MNALAQVGYGNMTDSQSQQDLADALALAERVYGLIEMRTSTRDVALQLGLSGPREVLRLQRAAIQRRTVEVLPLPPEARAAVVRSALLARRGDPTRRRFRALVDEVFVPKLRAHGYRKYGSTWVRSTGNRWPVIDIQRGKSDGDPLSFTMNYAVHDPTSGGSDPKRVRAWRCANGGRIGMLFAGTDIWWSICDGVLYQSWPPATDTETQCEAEISRALDVTLTVLDGRPPSV